MPLVSSSYRSPYFFRNSHLSTIYSATFRNVNSLPRERERITLPDGDFIDLDWSYCGQQTEKVLIMLHGLEGNSNRHYMLGTASLFNKNSFDCIAVNFRGCSGEPNKHYRSYHSGVTDDLESVLEHVLETDRYRKIVIKGFSLGGNVMLKYIGEKESLPKQIKAAVAISVPVSLSGSCIELHKLKNKLYHDNFKRYLLAKLRQKQKRFPEKVSRDEIREIKTLKDFDDVYTSRAHGFRDADHYYEACSSLPVLDQISIPTLILSARNDSFLSEDCYPYEIAKASKNIFLETPNTGGHVGFMMNGSYQYNEIRAMRFLTEMLTK